MKTMHDLIHSLNRSEAEVRGEDRAQPLLLRPERVQLQHLQPHALLLRPHLQPGYPGPLHRVLPGQ